MPAQTDQQSSPPPHVQLVQMASGNWVAQILYVAAKLGLADHLAKGAKSAEDVATATQSHAPSLYRVMRALANFGILTEDTQHRFALTTLGESLKTGAPFSVRETVLTLASPWMSRAWEELAYSVATGKTGFDKSYGKPIFDWLGEHPEDASNFNGTMLGIHGHEPAAIAAAYDFSGVKTLIDVGGSTGNMLATILGKFPTCRGILYDLPHVVRDALPILKSRGVADRVTIEAGSFFDGVPSSGDAYLMSHIIHDWSEAQCLTILGHCKRVMSASSRLLIVEMVLPDGDTPHPGKLLDIMMLVGPGGQERTTSEYEKLLAKAGLKISRVVPTESAVSVVEAELA